MIDDDSILTMTWTSWTDLEDLDLGLPAATPMTLETSILMNSHRPTQPRSWKSPESTRLNQKSKAHGCWAIRFYTTCGRTDIGPTGMGQYGQYMTIFYDLILIHHLELYNTYIYIHTSMLWCYSHSSRTITLVGVFTTFYNPVFRSVR